MSVKRREKTYRQNGREGLKPIYKIHVIFISYFVQTQNMVEIIVENVRHPFQHTCSLLIRMVRSWYTLCSVCVILSVRVIFEGAKCDNYLRRSFYAIFKTRQMLRYEYFLSCSFAKCKLSTNAAKRFIKWLTSQHL